MNRALLTALLLLASPPLGALAQIEEDPADKQRRVDIYQDRRLIYEADPKVGTYSLRQGPDAIYDADFVALMNDPSLTQFWLGQRNRDWAIWLGTGAVGIPLGTVVFYQNFLASGPFALFSDPQRTPATNASDIRSYALSIAGIGLAIYGAYSFSRWLLESLDVAHPNRLEAESILPRVHTFNDDLADRLSLAPEDIPSPPPPRPSPSPSPSPSDEPGLFAAPTPAITGNDDYPYGEPPEAMPTPLPLPSPGAVPSGLVESPAARPSTFMFPGNPGREPGTLPATPTPRPSARPSSKP